MFTETMVDLIEGAAVSTFRNDVDYVVTEYGIAWLRATANKYGIW